MSFYCCMCKEEIPIDRATGKNKAVTCSEACASRRKLALRKQLQESTMCKYCRRPASPAEKAAYSRFRKWEAEHPEADDPKSLEKYLMTHTQKPIVRQLRDNLWTGMFKFDPVERMAELAERIREREKELEELREAYDEQAAQRVSAPAKVAAHGKARAKLPNPESQGESGTRSLRGRVRGNSRPPSPDTTEGIEA